MNNLNGPYGQKPQPDPPQSVSLEMRFHKLAGWQRWGLISLSGLIFISTAVFLMVLVSASFAPDQPTVAAAGPTALAEQQVPTPKPTAVPTATPTVATAVSIPAT